MAFGVTLSNVESVMSGMTIASVMEIVQPILFVKNVLGAENLIVITVPGKRKIKNNAT